MTPDLMPPELTRSLILPPQKERSILPLTLRKEIATGKNVLPGYKPVNAAHTAEELNILIAHNVDHLGPQQQAGSNYEYQ
ncbi:Uncharacterised protein [Kluyvera intermedia]|nr:Uncharacterised protein [Kluyvera intermedia]